MNLGCRIQKFQQILYPIFQNKTVRSTKMTQKRLIEAKPSNLQGPFIFFFGIEEESLIIIDKIAWSNIILKLNWLFIKNIFVYTTT